MTSANKKFDCVVIGGGHNGLVAAAYLARGGKRVCVLERRHIVGGCSVTEELWPGFKVSVASYVISLFRPEIIRDLRLKQYGLNILPRNPSSFTPLLDGRSLLMGPDERATCREIAKFSRQDAERYPAYNRLLERVSAAMEPLHHVMGEAGGQRGVWGYVQGGMGALATALECSCLDLGVEIRREAMVKRILVDRGQVKGVVLWDDTLLEAPVVASSIDAHHT